MNRPATLLALAVLTGAVAVQSGSAQADAKLAQQAQDIFKKNCFRCHGDKKQKSKAVGNILELDKLVANKKLVKGDPAKSTVYQRMTKPADDEDVMPPPEAKQRPSKGDIELVAKWIKAGAPAPGGKPDPVVKKERKPEDKGEPKVGPRKPAGPEAVKLAVAARGVLQKHCYSCHGPGKNVGGIDFILDVKKLVAGDEPLLVPGDLKKSKVYTLVERGKMPKGNAPEKPTDDDKAILARWIEAGAPEFPDERRTVVFKSFKDTLKDIDRHLRKKNHRDRKYFRYFTFTHLNNDPEVIETHLRTYRAALSKVVNSMSWQHEVEVPEAVDKEGTILAIDLRKLDWDKCGLWPKMLKHYPYGLMVGEDSDDDELKDMAKEIYRATGTPLPMIRGDWFISTASRPPLYEFLLFETLMGLPKKFTDYDVEQKLEVNVAKNILEDKVWRAGFASSGVSTHNRMIERHKSPYGAYWKSYDFKSSADFQDLHRYPLGPVFRGNPYNKQAFKQDGGEVIFNLPNGLQGYLLIDGKGTVIPEGPTAVVRDKDETGGTVAVVNGISCMACHSQGMLTNFKDSIREGHPLRGAARDKVRRIYPKDADMVKLLAKDRGRFMRPLREAMEPFLLVGPDKDKKVEDFVEPVQLVGIRHVLKEVNLQMAAYELGLKDPRRLKRAIENNDRLQEIGLRPLARGKTIKRETWESLSGILSPFQETASALELGDPIRVR
jgi:serine/threonine-protein kinase